MITRCNVECPPRHCILVPVSVLNQFATSYLQQCWVRTGSGSRLWRTRPPLVHRQAPEVATPFLTRDFIHFEPKRTMSAHFGARHMKLRPLHHCRTRSMFAFQSSDSWEQGKRNIACQSYLFRCLLQWLVQRPLAPRSDSSLEVSKRLENGNFSMTILTCISDVWMTVGSKIVRASHHINLGHGR